jgi:hypothetical protein
METVQPEDTNETTAATGTRRASPQQPFATAPAKHTEAPTRDDQALRWIAIIIGAVAAIILSTAVEPSGTGSRS